MTPFLTLLHCKSFEGATLLINLRGDGPQWKCPRICPSRKGQNRHSCHRFCKSRPINLNEINRNRDFIGVSKGNIFLTTTSMKGTFCLNLHVTTTCPWPELLLQNFKTGKALRSKPIHALQELSSAVNRSLKT